MTPSADSPLSGDCGMLLSKDDILALVEKVLLVDASFQRHPRACFVMSQVTLQTLSLDSYGAAADHRLPADASLLRTLHLLCMNQTRELRPFLRRDLLSIIDALRPLAEDPDCVHVGRGLTWWLGEAELAGLFERILRKERAADARRCLRNTIVDCNWLKCARFGR